MAVLPDERREIMHTSIRAFCGVTIAVVLIALGPAAREGLAQAGERRAHMSPMGRLAAEARTRIGSDAAAIGGTSTTRPPSKKSDEEDGPCFNDPECPRGFREGPPSTQSELSIAVDRTGQYVVVGFNDFRGFSTTPLSVSGYMYSNDGGRTFVDGGQLPVTTGTEMLGTTVLPQVFGDPDVKYLGGCTFIYSSILLKKFSATAAMQTMGVHQSTDCGQTWQGPYEVEPASNPRGVVNSNGAPADDADKEYIDVDPDTQRVIMTWTNFTPTAAEIRSAFSDDGGLTWPAANGRLISATSVDGQASIPRFARGSDDVYVAWSRFPFLGALSGYGNTTAFARSTDNGETWQPPTEVTEEFLTQDLVLGNDRSNNNPSLAVDRTRGRRSGTIYVVYANNDSGDGADIVFQKSADRGTSFSAPRLLNSRPGNDRAQWFPWVSVDDTTGRVWVFYYDQGISTSGHVSEVTYLFSDDGGDTWEHPRLRRAFKAGHGNDTSQPNLGDYNQAVAHGGRAWFAYAVANRPPDGFTDGQPATSLTVPDVEVSVLSSHDDDLRHAPVNLRNAAYSVSALPNRRGDISVRLPLFNYATNTLYDAPVRFPVGILTTGTPGVLITDPIALYPTIQPGETRTNADGFTVRLRNDYVPGTPIDLQLTVISISGITTLHTLLFTSRGSETLLREDFEGVLPGALPAGWSAAHGGGANTVPWITSNAFCGTSNGAFHANANDGPPNTRWERLFSPEFNVPTDAEYVLLEFDVCYDTEDDPVLQTTAYDGFFLRITDLTPGRTLRSVLVEAFEDEFTTGDVFHYPKHLPRSGNTAYFQDMSAWAGSSGGVKHVRMRLPGMAGGVAQLRFEFTQDGIFTCQAVRPGSAACGVFVDNIVVKVGSSTRGAESSD
jgi:hypothetical protein